MNPSRDKLLDYRTWNNDVAYMKSDYMAGVSERTKGFARAMNISPRAFLSMQSLAHGKPNPFALPPAEAPAPTHTYSPTPGQSRRNHTIQIGRHLLNKGFVIWQHDNFDVDRGFVPEGGARVMQRRYDSLHHEGRALDFPLSHNSEARLDYLYNYLNQNRRKYGVTELIWKGQGGRGHYDHLHVGF
jgi:hypothetical protein